MGTFSKDTQWLWESEPDRAAQRPVGWQRYDKRLLLGLILGMALAILIASVGLLLDEPISRYLLLAAPVSYLILLKKLFWPLYRRSRHMLSKYLSLEKEVVIGVVERLLRGHHRLYRKSNVFLYPSHAEIFEVDPGGLIIRVEEARASGSTVDVGPVSADNRLAVEKLLSELDQAFLPRGV